MATHFEKKLRTFIDWLIYNLGAWFGDKTLLIVFFIYEPCGGLTIEIFRRGTCFLVMSRHCMLFLKCLMYKYFYNFCRNVISRFYSFTCFTQFSSTFIFINFYVRRMGCRMVPRVKDNNPLGTQKDRFSWSRRRVRRVG